MSSNGTANPSPAPSPAPSPSSPPPPPSNPPSSADPPSSQPPPPSQTPVNPPSSAPPPPASSNPPPPASSAPPPPQSSAQPPPPASSNQPPADTTRVVTAPSAPPSVIEVQTSIILVTPTPSVAGETPSVVVITAIVTPSNRPLPPSNTLNSNNSADPANTDSTQLQGEREEDSGGLSTGGKTAIAVVIPVVVVALLVLGALFFWRKRKQRKDNEDERRKEVEEYGYNPNHDPTLPAVGMTTEMAEDSSGYRGWGNTTTSSGRKASTTLTSGMTYSDSNSNPGGNQSPHSPTNAYSDANSNDPLVNGRRETLDSDGIAALGTAPTTNNKQTGVHRGPSNASSSYSAANHSDNSGDYPGMGMNNPQEYYEQGYGSYQDGPYGGNNAYGAGQEPVIRDVSARRNTRIENASVFPQGNSGVATNF